MSIWIPSRKQGKCYLITVRRPRGTIASEKTSVSGKWLIISKKGEPFSVRRKGRGTIDIGDYQLRSSSEHWHLVELSEDVIRFVSNIENGCAVGSENDPSIKDFGRRDDLNLGCSFHLFEPQALFFILRGSVCNIPLIFGECSAHYMTVVCQTFHVKW